MIVVNGTKVIGGDLVWEIFDKSEYYPVKGITINFNFSYKIDLIEALFKIKENIKFSEIEWFYYKNKNWVIDLDKFKTQNEYLKKIDFLNGKVIVKPELEKEEQTKSNKRNRKTYVRFIATLDDIMEYKAKKIFLSHKGIDKPIVRDYKKTLVELGFEPWLDEDSLIAGKELERGLLEGFNESCAAIFFITENFIDENFLSTEINYAISQKREKGDKFSIITIVVPNSKDNFKIPDLLKTYVWKQPTSDLEAIREILKALPIKPENIIFK